MRELTAFRENLILFREVKLLTQAELAKKLNISPHALAGYEDGSKRPQHSTLIKIADFFGISVDNLVRKHSEEKKELLRVESLKAVVQKCIRRMVHYPPELIDYWLRMR